ncbi:L,D-transpeptidase family protein [Spiribacter halobius]|uniref:L,D-TPase catalytic domain-containing protein n=1 Tax=Sediminicurvatus halobius TaxID=2182432 RepID=A0A2U2MWV7_9GAMM|nr:L,D-transpeptidase [Spiribacter halobius]PWG61348.1 hypothetical protein DEM34_16960 [Spiribacter halobius]UEX76738.1 L,D-transpeptidase [Spiribacter halobius]
MTGLLRCLLPLLLLVAAAASATEPSGRWVLVDTEREVTEVREGGERLLEIRGIAFGRGGVAPLHLNGDQTTPLGRFRITRIHRESRFHIFLGLNYPTLEHVDRARREGHMDRAEYQRTLDHALRYGGMPQDGPLGGHIGLHGIGEGDPEIHRRFHWTQGCIAMTNNEIERLAALVDVGTPVVVR